MKFRINLSRAHLKVLSAVFSNFVAVWVVAMFGTRDTLALTGNFIGAIVSLSLAIIFEQASEEI